MKLSNTSKTLFVPLLARAQSSRDSTINFSDPLAEELVDFFENQGPKVRIDLLTRFVCTKRAKVFDRLVVDFAQQHRKIHLIQLGSGLCTRAQRLKEILGPKLAAISEVDFPSVNALKRSFFKDKLLENHKLVDGDLKKDEWKQDLLKKDMPTVFLLEGVSMYLDHQTMNALVEFARSHQGPILFLFDYFPEFISKSTFLAMPIWLLGARFSWGTSNPERFQSTNNITPLNYVKSCTLVPEKNLLGRPFRHLYQVAVFQR